MKSKIKRNLYFEIKDRVIEERFNGVKPTKKTARMKVFGFDETRSSRELLMEILRDRMDNHKAKFVSPIIYEELKTLEVKKNGRIEHANNAHDDQIFSYLMALYVWYEGKNLMENFGLEKDTIYTDSSEETELGIDEVYDNIIKDLDSVDNEELQQQIQFLSQSKSISYKEWQEQQFNQDQKSLNELLKDKRYRNAWANKNHMELDSADDFSNWTELPGSVFIVSDTTDNNVSELQKQFENITNLR